MASQIRFVADAIEDLKNTASVRSRLEFFGEMEIARWENWLQMELLFLFDKKGADSWWEDAYKFHGRKKLKLPNSNKLGAQIDIVFRQKSADTEVYTALELKAKITPDQSIGAAMKDLLRINALKQTSFRAIVAIAAYLPRRESAYEELVTKIGGEIIDFGVWRIALFGWEGAPRSTDLGKEYAKWCADLKGASKEFPKIKNPVLI